MSVVVLAAPSGTGKTTVARALLASDPDRFRFSISATTRAPRGSERNGVDYHFLTESEFRAQIAQGAFLEWAEVHGRLYGTPMAELSRGAEGIPGASTTDATTVLDIDVQGAVQVRDRLPGAILIFLLPPSGSTLMRRLQARGTDSAPEIQKRLRGALEELDQVHHFHYAVVNEDVAATVQTVKSIAEIARFMVRRPSGLLDRVATLQTEIRDLARESLDQSPT